MADGLVRVPNPISGTPVDVSQVTTSDGAVSRQRMVLGDDANPIGLASVLNTDPYSSSYGLIVRAVPPSRPNHTHISIPARTTVLKTGSGTLARVVVATCGETGSTLTLRDGVDSSGSIISIINLSSALVSLEYDLDFAVGLTVVTSAGSDVGDVTILYS